MLEEVLDIILITIVFQNKKLITIFTIINRAFSCILFGSNMAVLVRERYERLCTKKSEIILDRKKCKKSDEVKIIFWKK